MKTVRHLLLLVMIMAVAGPVLAATRRVQCDQGDSLKKTIHQADPGETTRVTGICQERVTITTDRLTLDGHGQAVLDGGGGSSRS